MTHRMVRGGSASYALVPHTSSYTASHRVDSQWTVLTTVSTGFLDLFQNWLYWYRKLRLRSKLVVVAEDSDVLPFVAAYNLTYRLGVDVTKRDASEGMSYDTRSYKALVSRRATYLIAELDRSDFLFYTDVDTVWLANPFRHLRAGADVWGGLDDVIDGVPYFCTGLLAFRRTPATFGLLHAWNRSLYRKPQLNQPVFNVLLRKSGVVARPLSRSSFPSGDLFFGTKTAPTTAIRRRDVVVVHNNFVQGKQAKLRRFRAAHLYHPCRTPSHCTSASSRAKCELLGEDLLGKFRECAWGRNVYGGYECRADFAQRIATSCAHV